MRNEEVGLFTAASPDAARAGPFLLVQLPGLPIDQIQYFRLFVASVDEEWREHVVLMAHYPRLQDDVCQVIATLLQAQHPGAVLSFTREIAEGHADVHADSYHAEVAAVVAEVQRSGSWDESPLFRIRVQPHSYDVTIRWQKDHAEVGVRENAA